MLQRRRLFTLAANAAVASCILGRVSSANPLQADGSGATKAITRKPRFAISTYSYWRYRNDSKLPIEDCIDLAAESGFDGVEILHRQMTDESNGYLQKLKRRAFVHGLDLCGFSTHQSFISPNADERKKNVDHTIHCIELAYQLGIPTIRVNTGRWNTIQDFDELMRNKGVEPRLEGYTDEQGFDWVIDSLRKCLPKAEECGVILGLENHWGLGRDAAGVLKVIQAIDSPWLKATLDTGNFLENQYEQYRQLAPHTVLVQAKTYFGGGKWYTLDIDYNQVAKTLKAVNYHGYISLEFEGQEAFETAVPKSLKLLQEAFS